MPGSNYEAHKERIPAPNSQQLGAATHAGQYARASPSGCHTQASQGAVCCRSQHVLSAPNALFTLKWW